jgi:hypothetical protein
MPDIFALETHVVEIAAAMKNLLAANGVGRLKAERTAKLDGTAVY